MGILKFGDVWEDSDETGNIEHLNFDESALPMKAAFLVEVASPFLLRELALHYLRRI